MPEIILEGLLTGRPDGGFDSHTVATRAEVSAIIQRLVEKPK